MYDEVMDIRGFVRWHAGGSLLLERFLLFCVYTWSPFLGVLEIGVCGAMEK